MKRKTKKKPVAKKPKLVKNPLSFMSFDKTDSGFLAEVSHLGGGYRERHIHSKTLKGLADKIHKLIVTEGVK